MSHHYHLFSDEEFADPYPLYHQIRAQNPVYLDISLGCWVLTRYADIAFALASPDLSSQRVNPRWGREMEELQALFQVVSKQVVFLDPPDHTRVRALMNKAFTPRKMEGMHLYIHEIINTLLDKVQHRGHMDVIHDLAYPLPAIVIAMMLGVPYEEHSKIKEWTKNFAVFMGNPTTLETSRIALQSVGEFIEYFRYLFSQRLTDPKDDLLSAFIYENALSEEEILANCVLLMFAGHETTTNLIGNGFLTLMHHADQMEMLCNDWSLASSAIEELLRYESPTQWIGRTAKEAMEIGGRKIGKRQSIMLLLGAANRDPAQFPDPDRLDITRHENRHLAFGHNRHFCIGAALARLEGRMAIETLIRRIPSITLDTQEIVWQQNSAFRALEALPITF